MIVTDKNGVYLPDHKLWLDPHRARDAAFVSHAHADHMKRHGQVFCTPATAAMMRVRGATKSKFHHLNWGEAFRWGRALVSLYPAGHVLGSAQMLVECDGTRLLYSGDFKLKPGLSCENIEVPRADIVVMETTFGLPRYHFAQCSHVVGQIAQWCRETLNNGETPVLFCYSLGKGQEVLAGLRHENLPVTLHLKHAQIAHVYADHGVEFPAYQAHQQFEPVEGVLLCASQCVKGRWWHELAERQRVRTAFGMGFEFSSVALWDGCGVCLIGSRRSRRFAPIREIKRRLANLDDARLRGGIRGGVARVGFGRGAAVRSESGVEGAPTFVVLIATKRQKLEILKCKTAQIVIREYPT